MLHRPDAHAELTRAAEHAVRGAVAGGISDAIRQLSEEEQLSMLQIEMLQDAVCDRLGQPNLGWALAYIAGVQLAPSILQAAGRPATDSHPPASGAHPEHATPARETRGQDSQESGASGDGLGRGRR